MYDVPKAQSEYTLVLTKQPLTSCSHCCCDNYHNTDQLCTPLTAVTVLATAKQMCSQSMHLRSFCNGMQ